MRLENVGCEKLVKLLRREVHGIGAIQRIRATRLEYLLALSIPASWFVRHNPTL